MKDVTMLIDYFNEYDFYDNILSTEVKDKNAKDVLLKNCNFTFISTNKVSRKSIQVQRVYANRNVLALLIWQKKDIELTDARALYSRQIDEMAAAVDAFIQLRFYLACIRRSVGNLSIFLMLN